MQLVLLQMTDQPDDVQREFTINALRNKTF